MRHQSLQKGQALVALLVFMIIAATITSASVGIVIANSQTASAASLSQDAYLVAESGIENALLRLLRDPNYPGETLSIGETHGTVVVNGLTDKVITATATAGNFTRQIQAQVTFNNDTLVLTAWNETF